MSMPEKPVCKQNCQESLRSLRGEKDFLCSNNINVNIIATGKVRQDVEEFSRLAAKVGADFTAGHHVGVAAAAALVKRVSCALSFLSPFIQFQVN